MSSYFGLGGLSLQRRPELRTATANPSDADDHQQEDGRCSASIGGVVTATLPMFNLPEAGIVRILGIDMARTATNVVGNSIATEVVAKSEPHEEAEDESENASALPTQTLASA